MGCVGTTQDFILSFFHLSRIKSSSTFLRQLQTYWPCIQSVTHQYCLVWESIHPSGQNFPVEKPQCSNEPLLFIYRRKSQWQNSSDCLRSTRERGPAEIWHILWDLWESRTVFPRQAAFPASSRAAWSFSETLHGNYAEEIIWSSAN